MFKDVRCTRGSRTQPKPYPTAAGGLVYAIYYTLSSEAESRSCCLARDFVFRLGLVLSARSVGIDFDWRRNTVLCTGDHAFFSSLAAGM